jgi:hypothetical protein
LTKHLSQCSTSKLFLMNTLTFGLTLTCFPQNYSS